MIRKELHIIDKRSNTRPQKWIRVQNKCKKAGGFLPNFRNEQDETMFFKYLYENKLDMDISVGLKSSDSRLHHMYRNVFQWSTGQMAFGLKMNRTVQIDEDIIANKIDIEYFKSIVYQQAELKSRIINKPTCSFYDIKREHYKDESLRFTNDGISAILANRKICNLLMPPEYICESKKLEEITILQDALELLPEHKLHNQEITKVKISHCPSHWVVVDFLKCDQFSQCYDSELSECMSSTHFTCSDGLYTIPYTLVCDHRDECYDGSDEHFCEFQSCPEDMCASGDCLGWKERCDLLVHCIDHR